MPSRRHRPGLGLRVSCAAAVALVVCIAAAPLGALAQLSTAVAHDKQLKEVSGDNKYRDRKADLDKEGDIQHEGPVPGAQHCGKHRLDLGWMTEATSSVYATPLITDLHADGRRDIIVPSFVHYLEVLEGPNGGQAVGWPAFHSSSVHASPLLYDVDFDGVRDVLLATYDGQILFYKDTGDKMREGIQISRLRVRKDWYVGLDPTDPFDHTHPDAHADLGKPLTRAAKGDRDAQAKTPTGGSGGTNSMTERVRKFVKQISEYRAKYGDTAADKLMAEARLTNAVFYDAVMAMVAEQKKADGGASGASGSSGAGGSRRRLMSMDEGESEGEAASDIGLGGGRGSGARRRLMQAEGGATTATTTTTTINPDGSKTTTVVSTDPASGVTTTETTTVKPDGTTTSTSRSAVPEGTATVEAGPGGATQISKEAAESFDIFEVQEVDTATAVGGGGGVDPQLGGEGLALGEGEGIDAATQAEFEAAQAAFEAERARLEAAGLNNPDGDVTAEQLAAAGEGLGSDVDLDMFLSRLQYDEFGDLDATAEILAGSADEHEHGIDLNAADPDAFDSDHYKHLYLGDYVGGNGRGFRGWLDEDFHQSAHPNATGGYVYVDPHVMTTPAIADIDGDGHDDLVVAVSYFYDREYYDDPEHAKDLKGINIGKYVASGIAVFDLRTRTEKWVQHLDLSTDSTSYKAYAYSSPTLVDLDGDGKMEIVVGTSMGFLYVLDCKGTPVAGWPKQMGEIQAQPLVADINNDGELEVFAADMRGNLAAFSPKGEEVWERHVHSAVSQGAVAGDIDGDGQLEIVLGTASGHVYALAGSTGADIPHWPYRARGRIQAQPTITQLVEGTGLQVIVPAFDGFLYVIDGLQGCADVADIGETSYASVLVDDTDSDGMLELIATTMNGNVYSFETAAKYHPLKSWTSQVLGPNGQVARFGYVGIYASPASRVARDVAGERLQIQFEVVDKRVAFANNGTLLAGGRGPYNVSVVLKGVGVREMASGDAPVVGVADSFPGPGVYTVDIPCPRSQSSAVVRLELVDGNGLAYADEFALSFHMHFHRLLKWAVALPLGLMVGVLLLATQHGRTHAQ